MKRELWALSDNYRGKILFTVHSWYRFYGQKRGCSISWAECWAWERPSFGRLKALFSLNAAMRRQSHVIRAYFGRCYKWGNKCPIIHRILYWFTINYQHVLRQSLCVLPISRKNSYWWADKDLSVQRIDWGRHTRILFPYRTPTYRRQSCRTRKRHRSRWWARTTVEWSHHGIQEFNQSFLHKGNAFAESYILLYRWVHLVEVREQ